MCSIVGSSILRLALGTMGTIKVSLIKKMADDWTFDTNYYELKATNKKTCE